MPLVDLIGENESVCYYEEENGNVDGQTHSLEDLLAPDI